MQLTANWDLSSMMQMLPV